MKNILVTGGTIFVSKFVAQYFSSKKFCDEYKVYVLNRNNHLQVENVILINSSRQNLGSKLEQFNFDIVIDITSYTKEDVKSILHEFVFLINCLPIMVLVLDLSRH